MALKTNPDSHNHCNIKYLLEDLQRTRHRNKNIKFISFAEISVEQNYARCIDYHLLKIRNRRNVKGFYVGCRGKLFQQTFIRIFAKTTLKSSTFFGICEVC